MHHSSKIALVLWKHLWCPEKTSQHPRRVQTVPFYSVRWVDRGDITRSRAVWQGARVVPQPSVPALSAPIVVMTVGVYAVVFHNSSHFCSRCFRIILSRNIVRWSRRCHGGLLHLNPLHGACGSWLLLRQVLPCLSPPGF